MMKTFEKYHISLKWRLIFSHILVATVAIFTVAAGFILYEVLEARREAIKNIEITAQIVATNSAPALAKKNSRDLVYTLNILTKNTFIISAAITTPDGEKFVEYFSDKRDKGLLKYKKSAFYNYFFSTISHPIISNDNGKMLGDLSIEAFFWNLSSHFTNYTTILFNICILAIFISYFFASKLQRYVTLPIIQMNNLLKLTFSNSSEEGFQKVYEDDELVSLKQFLDILQAQNIELRDKKKYLNNIMKVLNEPLVVTNTTGAIKMINGAAAHLMRYGKKDLIGKSFVEFLDPHMPWDKYIQLEKITEKNLTSKRKSSLVTQNKEHIPIFLSGTALFHERRFSGVIFSLHDLRTLANISDEGSGGRSTVLPEIQEIFGHVEEHSEYIEKGFHKLSNLMTAYDEFVSAAGNKKDLEAHFTIVKEIKEDISSENLLEGMSSTLYESRKNMTLISAILNSLKKT
jgi:PAS domain-containing protein